MHLLRRLEIYAIIETGGKQYKATPGQTLEVERLNIAEGKTVELDKVLFIADGDKVTIGKPTIEGAKVIATSQGEHKDKKIIVFRYKPKTHYHNKTGHRQLYTRLLIDNIVESKKTPSEPTKKVSRRKKEVTTDGT